MNPRTYSLHPKPQAQLQTRSLPQFIQPYAVTYAFNSQVKFAGTAGLKIHKLELDVAEMSLANNTKVQNHIKGVHACGMALLAESATGAVFGMNCPDTAIPLIRNMSIDYLKVAKGDLRAVAKLSEEERNRIQTEEKGSIVVPVTVTDSEGKEPIKASMQWAWVPKSRV
eukprot:CAMPEP_0184305196 /NCGR_PEP_ID=MMETSP1049-20130417/14530_1 /TAXON_ID=77928 /ORGANISM="Proteomonas sulcata, Strain CCMP704" /LENGTH=168 /DNA_ID=CAMNT_0026617201 /DNA_START=115 /DNA_END=621 /DNA_ORIENTATION=+